MESGITVMSPNWSHLRSLLLCYFPHTSGLRCLIIFLGGSSSCGAMADALGASRTRGPFLFLPVSHCGTGNTLCHRKDTCNQPLTPPSHFESLSAGLRAGANPRCVYRTTDPTAGCPVCSFAGTLLVCGFIWMMCPHLCVCFFSTAAGYQGGISTTQQGHVHLRRYEELKRSLVLHIVVPLLANFTVPVSSGTEKK